ncbi:tail assembly protein [Halomonas cupida]|uniref:Tail assembly protein n=1 Tax=Halomonas cupida TaxID=44933 RepID=A0A1M7KH26_9GAMM|nr:phage tail protein [Halomonas cupida]GEN25407.1 tail assembly protein [Halomonas cupida]SHM64404.1 hypothetical protein SAMN05660971_03498 [Halomonas cupida]
MMMAYGLFVFALDTASYRELQRRTSWRHAPQSRVGRRPARQFLGPAEDTITLTGTLLPHFTGGQQNLDYLREMANQGAAWPLIEGNGSYYGLFIIEGMNEGKSHHMRDGSAQKIEFDLSLQRIDEDSGNALGRLGNLTARALTGALA